MKPISFTLNNLDFIINSFHTACIDRKPAMVDNPICIFFESFGKGNDRSYFTFHSYRTPIIQEDLSTFRISVMPELLQIILEDINSRKSLNKLKKSLQLWFLIRQKVGFILQKKVFAPLDNLFSLFGSLSVLYIPNLIYYLAKGSDTWN